MAATIPSAYKPISHYLKIAYEHANRDQAVYYWCIYYGLQCAMQIDKKSPDCVKFLTEALADLEKLKKSNKDNETITNEIVGQAHLEQYAIKLFTYADAEDRSARFDKNVVKAFYTAGYLFDVLGVFGEIDSKLVEARKYAKWKAAYIHNCLKTGQQPHPGPIENEPGVNLEPNPNVPGVSSHNFSTDQPSQCHVVPKPTVVVSHVEESKKSAVVVNEEDKSSEVFSIPRIDVYLKVQKCCKQASSALDYEDEKTAIENLNLALQLLKCKKISDV